VQEAGPPPAHAPLVLQISRWDRTKDMAGVMAGFAGHFDVNLGAHLLLAGPEVDGVVDDPEAPDVFAECCSQWEALPAVVRRHVHLACLSTADHSENSVVTNALQHHAAVVCQKSLAEGFGLTVAEAMWKARPVVASAVGGSLTRSADLTAAPCSRIRPTWLASGGGRWTPSRALGGQAAREQCAPLRTSTPAG
jgi:trehalose synthase